MMDFITIPLVVGTITLGSTNYLNFLYVRKSG